MTKSTRRALLSSVVALVICLTMLIGTTFAWFTDTASTTVNTIVSGKLDIALEMQNDDGKWESVEGKVIDFVKAEGAEDEEILWEPGCTYYTEDFRIVNNGNLALKFKVMISGTEGDQKLNEAINWSVLSARDNENDASDSPYTWSWKDTDGEEGYDPLDGEFVLLPDECVYLQLIGEMDEEAGNEYQGLSVNGVAITVVATQWTYEYDSNNNAYDAEAEYPEVVTTAEDFETALASGTKEIIIASDITYDWGTKSYENANNLAMSEKTFIGATGNETITFVGYGSANNIKDVTLKNVKVADNTTGDTETAWEHGYLEFENLTAENVEFVDGVQLNGTCTLIDCTFTGKDIPGLSMYAAWVNSGNVTFKNCSFVGTRGLKTHEQYGSDVESITVDGCTFTLTDKPGVVIGTLDATTTVTIKNSTFDGCAAGDQGKYIYESDTAVDTFNFTETNNTVK